MLINIGDLFQFEFPATWLEHHITFETLHAASDGIEDRVRKEVTVSHPWITNFRFSADFIFVEIFNKDPQIRWRISRSRYPDVPT